MATTQNATTPRKKPAPAKGAPRTTAKRTPAQRAATRTTARPAAASSTQPATRVAQLAERAVLIPLGAALEARDRVAGTVGELVETYRSRAALERQLKRFERRGGKARTELEREVRRTRTRIERETRQARRDFDRRRAQARRNLGSNVEQLSGRVENVVQNGVNTGMRLVNGAQDRIAKAA